MSTTVEYSRVESLKAKQDQPLVEPKSRRSSRLTVSSPSVSDYIKRSVYSLRTCLDELFVNKGPVYWTHLVSAILRIVAAVGIMAVCIFLALRTSGAETVAEAKDSQTFVKNMTLASTILSSVVSLVLLVSGCNSVVFLRQICVKSEWKNRYVYESIGIRVCTLTSIVYLGWVVFYWLSVDGAVCKSVLAALDAECENNLSFLLGGVVFGTLGLAGCTLILFSWLSIWFKAFTFFPFVRFSLGLFELMIAIACVLLCGLARAGIDNAIDEALQQFDTMTFLIAFNGITAGVIIIVTASFSIVGNWYRSKALIACDALIHFIVFWFMVQFCVAFLWPLDIHGYLRRYEELYIEKQPGLDCFLKVDLPSMIVALMCLVGVDAGIIFASFVTLVVALAGNRPDEWRIKGYLLAKARRYLQMHPQRGSTEESKKV